VARRRVVRLAILLALVLTVGPAPSAGAVAPTATASDTTDLVHGQEIFVRGQGWDPDLYVAATICAGVEDDDQCEQVGFGRPGPAGRFTIRAKVDAVLDLWEGPVDCRTAQCWLVVFGEGGWPDPDPDPVVIPVTFDPGGPDPARRPVDVGPTTDVVDGSLLTVSGEGFSGGGIPRRVSILPCRLPVVVEADCDGLDLRSVPIARDGLLDTTFRIDAILDLDGTPYDCRAGTCGLLVVDGSWVEPSEDLSESGLVPLAFDPHAPLRPAPAGSVTPSADLVDDQRVQVVATGFDPDERILLQQCVTPVPAGWDPDRCHAERPGTFATTDANGALTRPFSVFTTLVDWFDPYDCRVEACAMVLTQTSPYRRLVLDIGFDPAVDPLEPRVTVRPSQGLDDGQRVTVRGFGFRSWTRVTFFECPPNRYLEPYGCDRSTRQWVWTGAPDGGGPGNSFTASYRVQRHVRERDCAVRRCVLYVISTETIPDEVEVPLRFG
jgi:hypothetical protein